MVVDASVAVKWVIQEPGTAAAIALRSGMPLLAPDLLIPECAVILWKKVRRQELSQAEAQLAARLLQRAQLDLRPTLPLLPLALEMAVRLAHPAYDCMYLALAVAENTVVVTADGRFARAAGGHAGWRRHIDLLA